MSGYGTVRGRMHPRPRTAGCQLAAGGGGGGVVLQQPPLLLVRLTTAGLAALVRG